MTRYSVGIHIICLIDTSLSCVVMKGGSIFKEEPGSAAALKEILQTNKPDVILVTYAYSEDSLAIITKLLTDVNCFGSSVELVLNPLSDSNSMNHTNIHARFIQLMRTDNQLVGDYTGVMALTQSIQVLSHEVLSNLVTVTEYANDMLANYSPVSLKCEMFVRRLQLVRTRIQEVVNQLEVTSINKEIAE